MVGLVEDASSGACKCVASSMSMQEFLKRFLSHATMALSFWMLAVLAAEHLLPGFVASFVNVPSTGLFLIGLLSLAISVQVPVSRIGKMLGIVSCLVFGLLFIFFLWTKMTASGLSGVVIAACVCVSGGLTIYALAVDSTRL